MAERVDPFLESKLARIGLLLESLNCERRSQIIDVGANPINEPPYKLLLDADACHIWGFDPHPGAFSTLVENKSDNETYFRTAVGKGDPVTLNIYGGSGYTSVFKLREPTLTLLGIQGGMTQIRNEIEMDTVTLDSLDDLPQGDMLKIDIQGGELDVMRNGREKLSQAVTVFTEVPFVQLYEGAPTLGEVDLELRDQGFVFHRFIHQAAKVLRSSQSERLRAHTPFTKTQVIDGDAIYLRDISLPDRISTEQWKHLALFSDTVFNSNDLTVYCLDRLVERGAADKDLPRAYVDLLPLQIRL